MVCLQWMGFNCSMLSGQLGTLTHMHRPKIVELQRKECMGINDVKKCFILLMYLTRIAFLEIGKYMNPGKLYSVICLFHNVINCT